SPEEHDIIVSKIAAGLNSKNSYEVFNPLDKIKFGKLVAHSQAFITYDSDLLYIAAYCGTNCYWLNETINASTEGPEYFYCDVIKRYGLKEPIFKMADQEGINLSPIF